ncbi:MAG: DUF2812 domain-containing protein [Eubacteriales bacterium]|nr:DUF2812 domain-containing protein [Eubacteriales bacterium]
MKEEKVIHRWFWVWNFEKEERWLNTMAQSGWALTKVGFCTYHFVPCQPGEYTVRLEMHEPDKDYLQFMQDIGAEYVGRMVQWVYFRRKAELGQFDLFSDLDSKIGHLRKIGRTLAIIGGANLLIGLINSLGAVSIGWLNLLCATLLMYALGRIHGKMESLEKDQLLLEA